MIELGEQRPGLIDRAKSWVNNLRPRRSRSYQQLEWDLRAIEDAQFALVNRQAQPGLTQPDRDKIQGTIEFCGGISVGLRRGMDVYKNTTYEGILNMIRRERI